MHTTVHLSAYCTRWYRCTCQVQPRVYLILMSVAMMVCAIVVLILDRDLPTELLGSAAFLGGVAVLVNAVLDLTGNGKD